MSGPQAEVAIDSAETMSSAMSAEAGAVLKQASEADLNVTAPNVIDAIVSVDGVEAEASKAGGVEHGYRVGDLVWAKIKRHPWWPGQIHDPKDASEFAAKPGGQEGRLLVAFFGDGSFSWCLPAQLLPFVENFSDLSKDGTSKSFLNAVNKAVDEVSRVLDSYMTCGCISSEGRDALISRPVVENAGVKPGILVPEVDVARLSLPNYEASDVLSKFANFAKSVPSDSVLDLGVVRGWLSAFHHSKGIGRLQEYQEPDYIEGLEDNDGADKNASNDSSVPTRVPLGPLEVDGDDDGPSSPNSSASVDKNGRRQKSVNEIMAEGVSVPPKRRKRTPVVYVEIPISSTVKTSDNRDKDGPSGKKNDKGKVKDAESPNVARSGESKRKLKTVEAVNAKDNTSEQGAGSAGKKKSNKGKARESESPETVDEVGSKRKPNTVEAVDTKDGGTVSDQVLEEGDVVILTPRERKKSKYLSNPYVEPIGRVGSSSFKKGSDASKEMKADGEGERAVIITKPVEEDSSVYDAKEVDGDRDADLDLKLSSLKSKVDSHGKKAKSAKTEARKNTEAAREAKGHTESSAKTSNTEKSQEKSEKSLSKKSAESSQANADASLSLVLVFSTGFPLPSKDEILKVYSKFGRLKETDVFADSHSAQVVFEKVDDAEAAFKSSTSENPFGIESVETQWLRYGSMARGPHLPERRVERLEGSSDKAVAVYDALSEMNLIRNKLEITKAILGAYNDKFKEADKEILKTEFRNLAEGVEAFRERVNELAQNTMLS